VGSVIWEYDAASPRSGRSVSAFLDYKFLMFIGRRGSGQWPAVSPDLTLCVTFAHVGGNKIRSV